MIANDNALPTSITNLLNPTRYLSAAETAKMVRQALKEAFPEVKFSVRSSVYAGGASVRVGWTDGPTADQVGAIAHRFQGATFDGMTDSATHHQHAIDGQTVSFGADYVFLSRGIDRDMLDGVTTIFARADRADWLTLATRAGMRDSDALRALRYHPEAREFAASILRHLPQPQFDGRRSATADQVTFLS